MISASASRSVSYPASYLEASYLIAAIYIWELINSFIRDPSFSPKKIYFRQTFAFLRFIFRRSTLYLCVPCMLCFVHVNGFFFTGKHKIEFHCLSACVFYLTVDTLYVSFVSPGCQQESKMQESLK